MKPIKLEFSGLNSYREKTTIDFEKLMSGELTEAEFMNDSDTSETNEASENVE